MSTCPYYNATAKPDCQHKAADLNAPSCQGQLAQCRLRLDDKQLSEFIRQQVMSKNAELVPDVSGHELGIMSDSGTWLTTELIRRFGQRQGRGVETLFKIKQGLYKFATSMAPVNFGQYLIFPLERA